MNVPVEMLLHSLWTKLVAGMHKTRRPGHMVDLILHKPVLLPKEGYVWREASLCTHPISSNLKVQSICRAEC